ncbi:alpha-ketoglutarate dehydrogenase component 4-like [Diadema antillarum]|uniref:alpha-ketoglutarate dehydrogenase component 4-like n=2 Tax=Diadema TaxID=31174 RepID=UPI003A898A96
MMSVTRAIQAVRPHIPLIKFRYRGNQGVAPPVAIRSTQPPSSSSSIKPASSRRGDALEFYQLNPKYQRAALTQEEIDFINRGGPD